MNTTLNLNIVKTENAPCSFALKIEVLPPRVQKVIDETVVAFSNQVKFPGFRAGKVPKAVVLRRFRDDVLGQAKERLIEKTLEEVIESEKIRPVGTPEFKDADDLTLESDKSFTYNVIVESVPEFDLPDYKGLKLTRKAVRIADDAVEEVITGLRERNTTYEKTDKPAEEGDMLRADYVGTAPEGLETTEKSKYLLNGTNSWIILKQPEMLPGITPLLKGAVAGEERDLDITFPEDHYNKELAGQTVKYHVKINEVHVTKVPEATDELAKSLGVDTIELLRTRIAENLKQREEQTQEESLREQVRTALLQAVDFPLPPATLERVKNQYAGDDYQNALRKGATKEELEPKKPEMLAEAEKRAANEMRTEFVIQAVVKAENLKVEQDELFNALTQIAEYSRTSVDELIKKDKNIINRVYQSCLMNKALDTVISLADVTVIEPETGTNA